MTPKSSKEDSQEPSLSTTTVSACSFMNFPADIHDEILSYIDIQTLFCCRCVSKEFLNIFSRKSFTNLFHSRTNDTILVQKYMNIFYILGQSSIPTQNRIISKKVYFPHFRCGWTLINSVDGIVCLCLYDHLKPIYVIWNPVLKQLVFLPKVQELDEKCHYLGYSALGSCREKEKYKIIRFKLYKGKPVIRILTIGSSVWRCIHNVKMPIWMWFSVADPFVNGCLHWISTNCRVDEMINSFDVETEIVKPVPPPLHFDNDYVGKISMPTVGQLNGKLCLWFWEHTIYETWAMENYGVRESWTRKFASDYWTFQDQVHSNRSVWVPSWCGVRYKPSFVPLKHVFGDLQLPVVTYVSRGVD